MYTDAHEDKSDEFRDVAAPLFGEPLLESRRQSASDRWMSGLNQWSAGTVRFHAGVPDDSILRPGEGTEHVFTAQQYDKKTGLYYVTGGAIAPTTVRGPDPQRGRGAVRQQRERRQNERVHVLLVHLKPLQPYKRIYASDSPRQRDRKEKINESRYTYNKGVAQDNREKVASALNRAMMLEAEDESLTVIVVVNGPLHWLKAKRPSNIPIPKGSFDDDWEYTKSLYRRSDLQDGWDSTVEISGTSAYGADPDLAYNAVTGRFGKNLWFTDCDWDPSDDGVFGSTPKTLREAWFQFQQAFGESCRFVSVDILGHDYLLTAGSKDLASWLKRFLALDGTVRLLVCRSDRKAQGLSAEMPDANIWGADGSPRFGGGPIYTHENWLLFRNGSAATGSDPFGPNLVR